MGRWADDWHCKRRQLRSTRAAKSGKQQVNHLVQLWRSSFLEYPSHKASSLRHLPGLAFRPTGVSLYSASVLSPKPHWPGDLRSRAHALQSLLRPMSWRAVGTGTRRQCRCCGICVVFRHTWYARGRLRERLAALACARGGQDCLAALTLVAHIPRTLL